ncbi:MAG TPA: hypothetical protein VF588_05730 [Pyrinomonadaceae bacterium]|jgi:hypothetical protein
MMNNLRKVAAGLAVALSVGLLSSTGLSQEARGGGRPAPAAAPAGNAGAQAPAAGRTMSAEEKMVRDVYARLMRYQSAGVDGAAARTARTVEPQEYLTFELRNFHSGPVTELNDRPLSEVVTASGGAVLNIRPVHLSHRKDPAHAFYEAEWATAPEAGGQPGASKESERFAGFDRYISYQVTVRLNGRQRQYRAVAVYQSTAPEAGQAQQAQAQTAKPARVQILDNVTAEMNTVLGDESPRIRAPWSQYVKSSLYAAVIKDIKEKKDAGLPLIPASAPIGYLPADGGGEPVDPVDPVDPAACAGPSISGPTNVWWFNGQTPTGYATSITLTASPAGAGSYSWSVVAGSDKVTLSNFNNNTVTVTGRNASTFREVGIQVTVNGATSPTFRLSVRAPHRLVLTRDFVQRADATWGYDTEIHYRIEDQFTDVLPSNVPLNEHFTTGIVADFAGMDWRRGAEGGAVVNPTDWFDHIQGETAGHNPAPRNPCSPLCNTAVYHWDGEWFIGSTSIGVGRRVQTNTWQKFTDHAEHTNRTSPAP